jgi:hypothetical protein
MEFHVFFVKEGLTTLNLALYRAHVQYEAILERTGKNHEDKKSYFRK